MIMQGKEFYSSLIIIECEKNLISYFTNYQNTLSSNVYFLRHCFNKTCFKPLFLFGIFPSMLFAVALHK